jgi:prepilin-type N-terminal cleavage/methylation domain-containing protein
MKTTTDRKHEKKGGFTLIEVLIASVILTLGMLSCLALFTQSQRMMLSSQRFEIGQRVFAYGEMLYPIPQEVTSSDPVDDELLNVERISAQELVRLLELDLSPQDMKDLEGYYFERTVDEIEDEERDRNGHIYTIRSTISWGGNLRGMKPETETIIKLWRNKNGQSTAQTSGK